MRQRFQKLSFIMTDSCLNDSSYTNHCFEQRILVFLVRPDDLVNTCVRSPRCKP